MLLVRLDVQVLFQPLDAVGHRAVHTRLLQATQAGKHAIDQNLLLLVWVVRMVELTEDNAWSIGPISAPIRTTMPLMFCEPMFDYTPPSTHHRHEKCTVRNGTVLKINGAGNAAIADDADDADDADEFIGKSNQRWFDIEGMLCYNKGEEPPIDGWPSVIS